MRRPGAAERASAASGHAGGGASELSWCCRQRFPKAERLRCLAEAVSWADWLLRFGLEWPRRALRTRVMHEHSAEGLG